MYYFLVLLDAFDLLILLKDPLLIVMPELGKFSSQPLTSLFFSLASLERLCKIHEPLISD